MASGPPLKKAKLLKQSSIKTLFQSNNLCSKSIESQKHDDALKQVPFFGLPIKLCPMYNGDCQFESAANQLCSVIGLSETSDTCRKRAVEWISANQEIITNFVPDSNSQSRGSQCDRLISFDWNTYIDRMRIAGTYGDSITLLAMANVYNIQWIILSTNDHESCIVSKTDKFDPSLPVLILGHDVQRIHYVSLERRPEMEDIYINVRGMDSCDKLRCRPTEKKDKDSTTSTRPIIAVQSQCLNLDIPSDESSDPVISNNPSDPEISNDPSNSVSSKDPSEPALSNNPWPSIWSSKTWNEFKSRYSWLDCRDGKLGCITCSGLYSGDARGCMGKGLMASTEWVTYAVSESATAKDRSVLLASLRNKIKKHCDSIVHNSAETIIAQANAKILEAALQRQASDDEKETCVLFRTAYYLAKNNRPYSDQFDLVQLQEINGARCGKSLHSRYSATQIISHVAIEMRKALVRHLLESNVKLSVIIDESTTVSKKSTLCIYVRAAVNNDEPVSMFFDLLQLENQTADTITTALLLCFTKHGLTEAFLRNNWIGLTCDGASVMLGKSSGVAAQLRKLYPRLVVWHCLNHRLELCVGDAVSDVTALNHFKAFIDTLYALYSQSPKNQRELADAAAALDIEVLKIGRVLGVRWVASSFRTVKAIWQSYTALASHFDKASEDTKRDSKARSKFSGLLSRMKSKQFLCDLGLLYDVLEEVSELSLQLQLRSMTLPRADQLMKRSIRVLSSMADNPGMRHVEAVTAAEAGTFRGLEIVNNPKLTSINSRQFLTSLTRSMSDRLFSSVTFAVSEGPQTDEMELEMSYDTLLHHLDILNKDKFPDFPSPRYGEIEISALCAKFNLDERSSIHGFRDYVEDSQVRPTTLLPLMRACDTLACSSAECERGFSLLNIILTPLRNQLLIENVACLMFVNLNGPPVNIWNAVPYVKTWMISGHRSASDKRAKVCKKDVTAKDEKESLWKLF